MLDLLVQEIVVVMKILPVHRSVQWRANLIMVAFGGATNVHFPTIEQSAISR